METKLIKVKDIVIDYTIYPRIQVDFVTRARYFNALKSGIQFPPIAVNRFKGKYLLIDGAHRLEAHKLFGSKYIQAEILELRDKKDLYLEAVKRNSTHGKQFSTAEVTKIIITLKDFKIEPLTISQLIQVPVKDLNSFVAKRSIRVTGQELLEPLKATLQHMADYGEIEFSPNQKGFSGRNQVHIFDMLIKLIQEGTLNDKSEEIMRRIRKLYKLLSRYFPQK